MEPLMEPQTREQDSNLLRILVGARRFELRTSCSRSRRATRLRYAPTFLILPYVVFPLLIGL